MVSPTNVVRSRARRLGRRVRGSALTVPVLYLLGGIATAIGLVALDAAIGEQGVPAWLRVGEDLARSALVALATSFLFVVSVVFWVRIWALQMSAQPVLSRVLARFLTDTVQRHAMGAVIGAIAYSLVVVRAVPDGGSGLPHVPHLSVAVAFLLTLVVAVIIVFVVDNAARRGHVGHLIREITGQTVEAIRASHPPLGEEGPGWTTAAPRCPEAAPDLEVCAPASGWITAIDETSLLAAVPERSTLELAVRVGAFAIEASPVARIWTEEADTVDLEAVERAIEIGGDASDDQISVDLGIRELVDIAERSVTATQSDATTAGEAILHLGVVLRELLLHEFPATDRVDDADRRLLRTGELGVASHLDAAFARLERIVADAPVLRESLQQVLECLREQLDGLGRDDREELLDRWLGTMTDDRAVA